MSKVSLTSANSATARSTGFFNRIMEATSFGCFAKNSHPASAVASTALNKRNTKVVSKDSANITDDAKKLKEVAEKAKSAIKTIPNKTWVSEFYETISCGQTTAGNEYKDNERVHGALEKTDTLKTNDLQGVEDIFSISPSDHPGVKDINRTNFKVVINGKVIKYRDFLIKNKENAKAEFGRAIMSAIKEFAANQKPNNTEAQGKLVLDCVKGFYKFYGQEMQGIFMNCVLGNLTLSINEFSPSQCHNGISATLIFDKNGITYKNSVQYEARAQTDPLEIFAIETSCARLEYGASGLPQLIPEGTSIKLYNAKSYTTTDENGDTVTTITPIGAPIHEVKIMQEELLTEETKRAK